jgi:hypothetical protein
MTALPGSCLYCFAILARRDLTVARAISLVGCQQC